MEELFDVVDADDNVIGRHPRSVVHRRKLRHRAVHIFLFRSDGCLLVHLRTASKEEFPSVWTSSAAGHVAAGEDYPAAAARELQEELGLQAPLRRLLKVSACPDTSHEFTVLFAARSDDHVVADPEEIADVRWLQIPRIQSWLDTEPEAFSPAFRLLFHQFQAQQSEVPEHDDA